MKMQSRDKSSNKIKSIFPFMRSEQHIFVSERKCLAAWRECTAYALFFIGFVCWSTIFIREKKTKKIAFASAKNFCAIKCLRHNLAVIAGFQ